MQFGLWAAGEPAKQAGKLALWLVLLSTWARNGRCGGSVAVPQISAPAAVCKCGRRRPRPSSIVLAQRDATADGRVRVCRPLARRRRCCCCCGRRSQLAARSSRPDRPELGPGRAGQSATTAWPVGSAVLARRFLCRFSSAERSALPLAAAGLFCALCSAWLARCAELAAAAAATLAIAKSRTSHLI